MTNRSVNALGDEDLTRAFRIVEDWLLDRTTTPPCVVCGTPGLSIENQSVPPYAEWYQLDCTSCGLETTLNRQNGCSKGSEHI